MKKPIFSILFFSLLICSWATIFSQNPTTIVWQGTLTDVNGETIKAEECKLQFSIANSDGMELFNEESVFTTSENGEFVYSIKNVPSLFKDIEENQLVDFNIILMQSEGAQWLEEDNFTIKYHFERSAADSIQMTRFEGQTLNITYLNPIWRFSDEYPLAYLSSIFMISYSEDFSDPMAIMQICNKMPLLKEDPAAPAKRGIKGGFAVGGYQKR